MRRVRAWPLIALAIVTSVAAASCGGATPDDAAPSASPVVVDGESAAGAEADDSWDEADGPGIVTLRPVVTCDPDVEPDEALDEAVLPHVDDRDPCVVGPPAGTGQVFERNSAVASFDETTEQWVVDVDLRAAGQVVVDALAERCAAGSDDCRSGRIAVVLDEVIQSAPEVQTLDIAGTIRISGDLTEDQARMLARALNRDTTPAESDEDTVAAAEDDTVEAEASQPVATTSVPVSAAPTTAGDRAADDAAGFPMPTMCGLPAAEWTTDEHPGSQDQGTWATGSRDEGDLDGDGAAEFAWATVCGQGTVAVERAVHVFDSERRLMETLPVGSAVAETYSGRTVHALEPRVVDDEVQVEVWVWQSSDATCCPSVSFEMSFAWDGSGFAPTTPVPDPATAATPTGEAPVVDWDGEYRPTSSPGRVVRLGEFGRQVELLQQALDERGYDVDVDGYFGRGTEAAVRQFQRDRALPVTGVASDDVWDEFDE